jgi:transcriptional regulator with XRE-family HTH domain
MDRMIAFGARIKALRENLGFSQERLAELASLHRTYIGGVERGERNVSLINIWRIAEALGINPSALFMWSDDATSSTTSVSRRDLVPTKPPKKDTKWTRGRR